MLFSPLKIRGVEFRNRAWVSPMCQYSAVDGVVGEWHRVHLGAFSSGGTGLVMVEATAVNPVGRISIVCPGIWSEVHSQAFRPMVDFAHTQGAKIGIQLAHAGRKGSTSALNADHPHLTVAEGGWENVAPSAIAYEGYPTPRELTQAEIHQIVEDFVAAANRAVAVGFDVLEIHAAHGYLMHEFMSPLSNHRTDEYGGDFEGRTRIVCEVVTKIRASIPETLPLFIRISATDWTEGGWDLPQSIQLAKILKELGVDLIDVSTGGNLSGVKISVGPGYQVPFGDEIRKSTGVLTSSVGLITDAHQAEEILTSGKADAVMLAREMLRNPHWPMMAAEELGEKIEWPIQFERARRIH
jgi:2,4-dienoyl-CoA reductase-like NADH-dependent reductase (Old Yellow Enzyme family)